jgi:hypothetical protein
VSKNIHWDLRQWPPDLQWHEDNKARDVIIYCGSTDFLTDNGEEWVEIESGQNIAFKGTKVEGTEDGDDQWTLCEDDEYAKSMVTGSDEGEFDLVFLCPKLLEPSFAGEANLADRATFERMHQRNQLDYGVFFDESIRRVLSFELLHEMFHVSQNSFSQYCPSRSVISRYMLIDNHCSASGQRILWMV